VTNYEVSSSEFSPLTDFSGTLSGGFELNGTVNTAYFTIDNSIPEETIATYLNFVSDILNDAWNYGKALSAAGDVSFSKDSAYINS